MEILSFLIRTILFSTIVYLLGDAGMWDRVSVLDLVGTGLLFVVVYGVGPVGFISFSDFLGDSSDWDFGDFGDWGDGGSGF